MDTITLNQVLVKTGLTIAGLITGLVFWKIVEMLYDLLIKKE